MVLLGVNDHVFKLHCPSWWTGKLSDVAGLAFFPLLPQALWEAVTGRRERPFLPSAVAGHVRCRRAGATGLR
ncbi:hypothetical protein F0U61_42760 [Archangium violaceum]|uniref:hypothetical protein n=1 Tax=Archangium violaceum TaxID=83451 RepID=UPI002B2B85CD|nr:hypothetical protein F0U61_42760 [Archangium violaceum]